MDIYNMPHWAKNPLTDGSYFHVYASLPTRDGRATGNAVVLAVVQSLFDGSPMAIVATDAGNVLRLNENELKQLFYPPEYAMANFLPAQQKAWELVQMGAA